MSHVVVPCSLLVLALTVGTALTPDARAQDKPKALQHEGKPVNGLRLEVAAKFVPEEEGWGAPKLETAFTFHNETDKEILLDGYSIAFRLILSRLSPPDAVETSSMQTRPWCPNAPEQGHVIRIPSGQKHVITKWQWCDTLEIPFGKSVDGKVSDADTVQLFKIKQTGKVTVAFLYRSDGAYSDGADLAKSLKPGEKFWSGRVYSNPVILDVSKLRQR